MCITQRITTQKASKIITMPPGRKSKDFMGFLMISGQFLDCWDLTGSHLLGDQAQRFVSEVSVCIGSWPGPRVCAESGGHHATMALVPTYLFGIVRICEALSQHVATICSVVTVPWSISQTCITCSEQGASCSSCLTWMPKCPAGYRERCPKIRYFPPTH